MLQFPQGRIPTKMIAKRCPYCHKYPNTTMRYHLKHVCDLPDNPNYEGPSSPKQSE